MSDYNSSLPVRTESAGDLAVKIVDATVTSQQLAVNSDGSINITDNGGAITVDGSVTVSATNLDIRDLAFATDKVDVTGSEVSLDSATLAALENITVSATNLDIRDLAFATDKVDVGGSVVALDAPTLAALESITVQNGAGAAAVNIQDGGNSITVDGTVGVSGTVAVTQSTSPWVVSSTDLDIRDLAFATDKVDVGGSVVALDAPTLAALENITVSATNLDIRDLSHSQDSVKIGDGTDFLAVNTDGSINVVVTDNTPGVATNDYNTAAAIAGGASSTHTFTSTGNFYLTQIECSASGKMKIEVTVNGATKFVKFNSTADTNMSITLSQPALATTGQTVTIIRTNKDNQAQDLYSTISGYTL